MYIPNVLYKYNLSFIAQRPTGFMKVSYTVLDTANSPSGIQSFWCRHSSYNLSRASTLIAPAGSSYLLMLPVWSGIFQAWIGFNNKDSRSTPSESKKSTTNSTPWTFDLEDPEAFFGSTKIFNIIEAEKWLKPLEPTKASKAHLQNLSHPSHPDHKARQKTEKINYQHIKATQKRKNLKTIEPNQILKHISYRIMRNKQAWIKYWPP